MKLILYHFENCSFCIRVSEAIARLKVPDVELRDILEDPEYMDELIAMNGQRQVPCLIIDGKPMLESLDIIDFLEKTFGSN